MGPRLTVHVNLCALVLGIQVVPRARRAFGGGRSVLHCLWSRVSGGKGLDPPHIDTLVMGECVNL